MGEALYVSPISHLPPPPGTDHRQGGEHAAAGDVSVNLKTAKALGLAISEAFLLRADEVIE